MYKKAMLSLAVAGMLSTAMTPAFAGNTDPPSTGKISGRTVLAGVTSLLIWPGIGQAINSNKGDKVVTHVVVGLLPPFRIWSGYDALVDRSGGYWDGRI
ncbi:MAG: hypothetical protein KTR14_03670 [Vampirovibrio sp.]|nr:hypothetical protein [Vampirovibrio sp.]